MISLAIWSALIGSILGIRFRFVVLFPVIALGAICLGTTSGAEGAGFSQTIVAIVIFATLLQFGYFGTALVKHAVLPGYIERRPSLGTPKLR